MPSLYIANTSKKHNEFLFRLPGNDQLRRVFINAGAQQQVLNSVQKEDIEAVIAQHKAYGLVEYTIAHKIDKFSGMVYSIDKPISASHIQQVLDKNDDVLLQEGYELRKVAAVATNASLEETLSNSRVGGTQKSIEIEVEEIPEEKTVKRKMLKQKIKVTKD